MITKKQTSPIQHAISQLDLKPFQAKTPTVDPASEWISASTFHREKSLQMRSPANGNLPRKEAVNSIGIDKDENIEPHPSMRISNEERPALQTAMRYSRHQPHLQTSPASGDYGIFGESTYIPSFMSSASTNGNKRCIPRLKKSPKESTLDPSDATVNNKEVHRSSEQREGAYTRPTKTRPSTYSQDETKIPSIKPSNYSPGFSKTELPNRYFNGKQGNILDKLFPPQPHRVPLSQITAPPPRFVECAAFLVRKWINKRLPMVEPIPITLPIVLGAEIEYVLRDGECVTLGSGSYANVFLCRMKSSGKLVALKLNEKDSIPISKFVSECTLQQRVSHTGKSAAFHGIVAMELSRNYMRYGVVTEFIGDETTYKARSLAQLISEEERAKITAPHRQTMSKMDWMTICLYLVKCLRVFHRHGVVHGDIKGDNILLKNRAGRWYPVFIDFGLSGLIESHVDMEVPDSEAATFLQKYQYLAPEYVYERKLTRASDVYSLGMMLDRISHLADLNLNKVTDLCLTFSAKDRVNADQLFDIMQLQQELLKLSEEYERSIV